MISEIFKKILLKQDPTEDERNELVQYFTRLQNAPQQLEGLFSGGAARITAASQITQNAGIFIAGKFITPAPTSTSPIPTEAGFTGSFMSGSGETFLGTVYNIGGATGGVLQWGANQSNGRIVAGAGGVQIYSLGIVIANNVDGL